MLENFQLSWSKDKGYWVQLYLSLFCMVLLYLFLFFCLYIYFYLLIFEKRRREGNALKFDFHLYFNLLLRKPWQKKERKTSAVN